MATVHPQTLQEPLPPGWECRYDPRTGRYYFINHVDHATTWDDPRLCFPQVQQGSYAKYYLYGIGKPASGALKGYTTYFGPPIQCSNPPPPSQPPPASTTALHSQPANPYYCGSPRTPIRFKSEGTPNVQVEERIMMKLCLQFPTVEEGHIWQLLKQYHNRENVVVSALLAEGHPRAQTHPSAVERLTPKLEKEAEQPLDIDDLVLLKLHGFFPAVDLDIIRGLLRKHKNEEHEVISALVSGSWKKGPLYESPHPSSPKMKLRYMKLVFPEVDEAMLFDILYNCDHNALEATKRLTAMGYKKRDTPINRHHQANNSQPSPRPTIQARPIIVGPPNTADKANLLNRLQSQFPAISRTLVNMALESSNFNEDRAKQFLTAMTPQDGAKKDMPQGSGEQSEMKKSESLSKPSTEKDTDAKVLVVPIERKKGESHKIETVCRSPSLRTDSPIRKPTSEGHHRPKFKRESVKISKSTNTSREEVPYSSYRICPKGPDASLRKGPNDDHLLKEYIPWLGSDPENRRNGGPNASLRHGPNPNNLASRMESRAKGPCRDYRRGPLTDITHQQHSLIPPPSVESVKP